MCVGYKTKKCTMATNFILNKIYHIKTYFTFINCLSIAKHFSFFTYISKKKKNETAIFWHVPLYNV